MESVHTKYGHGYSEGLGVPDWRFWHEGLHQTFDVELKGARGKLGPFQKRTLPSMRRGGIRVFVWWPRDWAEAERVFQFGLGEAR
jgi:hypothetical protein